MKREPQSLFDLPDHSPAPAASRPRSDWPADPVPPEAPLAERMRPRTLEEYVGQQQIVGNNRLITRLMASKGNLPSLILWGGPGSGKTTLARLLSRRPGTSFQALSAVLSGVKELREAIAIARTDRRSGRRTVLFIDEIHRFNKSQQDALLPAVEDGTVTLIGATTENPSFEVNAALLSRARVVVLEPLSEDDVLTLLNRALTDTERGLGNFPLQVDQGDLLQLAKAAGGDARVALTALETAAQSALMIDADAGIITWELIKEALGRSRFAYDKQGEDHYNLISALIKSLRNSNPDAGLYWLARLIEGGADPKFIMRRLCILASEDVGMADPQAMVQTAAAAQILQFIGLPEGLYPLSQAVLYLAQAPKSNAIKRGYFAAAADAAQTAREPVPLHLRNAVTNLMKGVGYGEGYRYVHNDPAAADEMECLPEGLAGRTYFEPPDRP